MLELNGPAVSACHWDEPQCLYAALRYHDRSWPWQGLLGPRLVVEVTDSKHPEQPAEILSLTRWDRFLRTVHDWPPDRDGVFHLGRLRFTKGEVDAFVDRVDAGDFYRHVVATT
jgi:hypothetical protein